jgi:lysophospholipid acyltransferase (LPLAT)-like uncharacterized protein
VIGPKLTGSFLGYLLLLWRASTRICLRGEQNLEKHPGAPIAVWHGRIQGSLFALKGKRLLTMASASNDGEIAARAARPFGVSAVRGSTGKGGSAALDRLVDAARTDSMLHPALTVDGPTGPARRARPGIVRLSAELDRPILPISFSCRPYWRLTSWDRGIFAPPGARVVAEIGAPVHVSGTEELQKATARVERALDELTDRLDEELHGRVLWDDTGEEGDG